MKHHFPSQFKEEPNGIKQIEILPNSLDSDLSNKYLKVTIEC